MAQDLIEKIRAAAQAKGVDPEVAVSIARAESSLNPNAKANSSTAGGLFGVINSTWEGYKGAPGKKFDPDENIRVGMDVILQNTKSLRNFLGRDPSAKEVYAAHHFGPRGAQDFLSASADTPTSKIFSEKVLLANPHLKDKTAGQVMSVFERKMTPTGTANVSRETSVAKKDREPLPPSLPPMAEASPTKATVAMASGRNMPDIKSMPASYQAAFALAALADAKDDEKEYDENKETESEKLMREYKPVNHLASLDLSVTPITMAEGGEVDAEKRPDDINYFSNVNRMKDRGTTTDSVMLGARTKAGEGSVMAGLNMANMSKDEKMQTARALMLAYTQQDPEGLGFSANVVKPQGAPAMANLIGSMPLGEGRVSAGMHGNQAYSLGYERPVEGGQFNANLNVPRGTMGSPQLNLQFNKRFANGGDVDAEDLTKPSFGNPNIKKQGEAARRLAAMRDVNTLPDPKTYAAVAGALGTRPDQMGFSVLHPKRQEIMDVANPAFALGTALQIAPVAQGPGMGRMVGAAERALEPAVRRTLEGGGKASQMLQDLAAPPSQMFVRARPEAAARHADLQAQGLSPEQIRAQNLTLVDNRGNLIEEISDAPAVLQQKTASVQRLYYDMLKHPELESIYPGYDMPFVQIGTTRRKDAPLASASFDEREGIRGVVRDLPGDDARNTVRGTLLHEGQHAIQSMEGFTEGANPSAFVAYIKAQRGTYHSDPTVNENVIREMERAYPNLPEVTDRIGQDLKARYGKVFPSDKRVGEALYRHMPGEVQADLARIRGNLTPEELKATPLETSMQQLNINPANILQMSKSGSRPDRQIGDLEYDVYGYAHGGPVYRAEGSPKEGERKLDRETMDMLRRQGTSPASLQRVAPPADISSSAAGLPGLMLFADPRIDNTNAYGYMLDGGDDTKNRAMAQAMFLNKSRAEDYPDTIAHETEHLLARQNLGSAANINSKFDELIGNKGTSRLNFVRDAVKAAPYLKEKYDLQSSYLDPKMFEYQSKFGLGKNLLYEQLASLAALEQRHKIDLTKDPELRKTLFSRPDVRETYNALTGLRQTRLDPRDLPPHTRVPEPGMLDAIKGVFKRAEGGPVYRADGSPEEGERLTPQQIEQRAAQDVAEREAASNAAFIAQKSGIGRKAGPVSQALQSGQGQIEFLKGMTNVPQNILGAPMDISNMIANVYGGGVEKPFMGSEYIKEGLRAKGLGFTPSTDPTLAGFYGAGDLGSNLVNPAGVTRAGVQAAGKTGEAARMLAQDFQQYNQNLAVPGASYAVRNKGTPFIMTPERTTVSRQVVPEMNEADAYADKLARFVDTGAGRRTDNPALANWFRTKVGAYLRRDFGTEQDQMVQAADKGLKMHFTSPRFLEDRPYALSRNIAMDREREGFPKAGFAKTAKGQEAEAIIDSSIYPVQLQDVPEKYVPQNMKQFMGTNPEMRLSEMGTSVDENLKLEKLADEMDKMFNETVFKAYGEQVPMPKNYVLTEKTLEGLTPAQASNRVALKQEWTAKKQAEFAGVAIVKDPKIVSHSYDNGSKWISPADLADNSKHAEMVKDIGCAGGWCTNQSNYALDAGSGDNRLNILLDKKFEPRVQLTVNNPTPSMRDFATYMSEMGDNSVATKLQTANYGWNTAGGRNSMGVDALVETELKAMPEYQDFIKQNQATKNITEIKGQFNTVDLTKSPYLKQVQDFVKRQGPELQSVDNLDGINMVDMRDKMPNLSQYGKELLGRMVKLNGNSYFAGKDEFSNLIKKASEMPNNAARQIQMNMFQPPAEKAYGGMIERQPTDNRRYL